MVWKVANLEFHIQKKKILQKKEGKIRHFQTNKKWQSSFPADLKHTKKKLKKVLHTEGKWYQIENRTYTKEWRVAEMVNIWVDRENNFPVFLNLIFKYWTVYNIYKSKMYDNSRNNVKKIELYYCKFFASYMKCYNILK